MAVPWVILLGVVRTLLGSMLGSRGTNFLTVFNYSFGQRMTF